MATLDERCCPPVPRTGDAPVGDFGRPSGGRAHSEARCGTAGTGAGTGATAFGSDGPLAQRTQQLLASAASAAAGARWPSRCIAGVADAVAVPVRSVSRGCVSRRPPPGAAGRGARTPSAKARPSRSRFRVACCGGRVVAGSPSESRTPRQSPVIAADGARAAESALSPTLLGSESLQGMCQSDYWDHPIGIGTSPPRGDEAGGADDSSTASGASPAMLPPQDLERVTQDEAAAAACPSARPKGRPPGKVPPPPKAGKAPPPSKRPPSVAPGLAGAALPEWAGPAPPEGWQAACVVNWQPIRDVNRFEGSIWETVNDNMQRGFEPLPDASVAKAFGRRASSARPRERQSVVARQLPQQLALTADLRHAQLLRCGIDRPEKLSWVVGSLEGLRKGANEETAAERQAAALVQTTEGGGEREPVGGAAGDEELLSEEALEALLGLLDAASGSFERACAERSAAAADETTAEAKASAPTSKWAPSECFLRRLLDGAGPVQALRPRVELALRLARFPAEIAVAEREIRLALSAISGVMGSRALPMLLEGVLLLGNYVNAGSKTLGAAVGVTLESLCKLAHTRCTQDEDGCPTLRSRPSAPPPPKPPCGSENALQWLVRQLQQRTPNIVDLLLEDLGGCSKARDVDLGTVGASVGKLGGLVKTAQERCSLDSEASFAVVAPQAVHPRRLRRFLEDAEPKLAILRTLLEELRSAAVALHRHLAEPAGGSLAETLRRLAALREALPPAKGAPPLPPCPQPPRRRLASASVARRRGRHALSFDPAARIPAVPPQRTGADAGRRARSWPEEAGSVLEAPSSKRRSRSSEPPIFGELPHRTINGREDEGVPSRTPVAKSFLLSALSSTGAAKSPPPLPSLSSVLRPIPKRVAGLLPGPLAGPPKAKSLAHEGDGAPAVPTQLPGPPKAKSPPAPPSRAPASTTRLREGGLSDGPPPQAQGASTTSTSEVEQPLTPSSTAPAPPSTLPEGGVSKAPPPQGEDTVTTSASEVRPDGAWALTVTQTRPPSAPHKLLVGFPRPAGLPQRSDATHAGAASRIDAPRTKSHGPGMCLPPPPSLRAAANPQSPSAADDPESCSEDSSPASSVEDSSKALRSIGNKPPREAKGLTYSGVGLDSARCGDVALCASRYNHGGA
mmetsp:Transcript_127936/g.409885  ORF Transcript_127936/g.409885 Transcript_127936/m.409885 type:complete len:1142 (-) Transcript_127936:400-3825(-)